MRVLSSINGPGDHSAAADVAGWKRPFTAPQPRRLLACPRQAPPSTHLTNTPFIYETCSPTSAAWCRQSKQCFPPRGRPASRPHTNPSSDSSLISRFCFPKNSTEPCRSLANYALCANSHLVSSEVFSGPVWEVCLARGMKEPIIIIIELFRAVWCEKKGGRGQISRELTKGGGFNPNIADPRGNYRGYAA